MQTTTTFAERHLLPVVVAFGLGVLVMDFATGNQLAQQRRQLRQARAFLEAAHAEIRARDWACLAPHDDGGQQQQGLQQRLTRARSQP